MERIILPTNEVFHCQTLKTQSSKKGSRTPEFNKNCAQLNIEIYLIIKRMTVHLADLKQRLGH